MREVARSCEKLREVARSWLQSATTTSSSVWLRSPYYIGDAKLDGLVKEAVDYGMNVKGNVKKGMQKWCD